MKIALDFDNTYTLNPNLWIAFIDDVRDSGGDVYIVTVRHEYWDAHPLLDELMGRLGVMVVFTDGRAKWEFCEELGLSIDVWIDDRPQTIHNNSTWSHESPELAAWRQENYDRLKQEGHVKYVRDLSLYEEKNRW